MSTSTTFTGYGFTVQSASAPGPARVRVHYSHDPKQSNPADSTDGLNPARYTLTGSIAVSVNSVVTVSGDPQTLELLTSLPLSPGTWTVAVTGVQTPSNDSLSAPTSATFDVPAFFNSTGLSGGAEDDDPARIIRKHLSPALEGVNWDALIEGLSQGDDIVWKAVRAAYDQLRVVSASGKYLDLLGSNVGLRRPTGVGLSDELFRQLITAISNEKLTLESIRAVLEVYYGRDASRAYIDSGPEPFALDSNPTLNWVLDEQHTFTHTFESAEFQIPNAATATEVAAALSRTMRLNGGTGAAESWTNPNDGLTYVRIYSGSRGLRSFARVSGGTAQTFLHFQTELSAYTGTITPASNHVWTFTHPTPLTTKMTLAASPELIEVSAIEPGDYMVVSVPSGAPEGSYTVLDVEVSPPSITVDAQLEVVVPLTQQSNTDYMFFRPSRKTILSGNRTVLVSQTTQGNVDIQVPATTAAVVRGVGTGAYLKAGDPVNVTSWRRIGNTVTLNLSSPVTLRSNEVITVEGLRGAAGFPWVSTPTLGTYPAVGVTGGSYSSHLETTQDNTDAPNTVACVEALLLTGDVLVAGGHSAGVESKKCARFRITGTSTVADGSIANGSTAHTYEWVATADMATARRDSQVSVLSDGRVLVTAGRNTGGTVKLNDSELYTPGSNTWSTHTMAVGGALARYEHAQVSLLDGRAFVMGGQDIFSASTYAQAFDPSTLTWTAPWTMAEPRSQLAAALMTDGRVLAIGGRNTSGGDLSRATCEIFDPTLGVWSYGPSMAIARRGHKCHTMADGSIVVIGGRGYDATHAPIASDLDSVEILEQGAVAWAHGATCPVVVPIGTLSVYVAAIDSIVLFAPDQKVYTYHNRAWSMGAPLAVARDAGVAVGGVVVRSGGSPTDRDIYVCGVDKQVGAGLNGVFQSNSVVNNSNSVSYVTPHTGLAVSHGSIYKTSASVYSAGNGYTDLSCYAYAADTAVRSGGTTTLTLTGSRTTTGLRVGDEVWVNVWGAVYTSGIKTISALSSTAISYLETGGNVGAGAVVAAVFPAQGTGVFYQTPGSSTTNPGPFIYDPVVPASVGASVTLTDPIVAGLVDRITVSSTAGFPDSPGYFVLDFGGPTQSQPIAYLETLGSTVLLLAPGQVITESYASNTKIVRVLSRNGYVPVVDAGNLYITGSTQGQVAARETVESIAAAGISLNISVTYPGDRGLGGEGLPTSGSTRLSDVVTVWGGDT
jgi:hypothetical protein